MNVNTSSVAASTLELAAGGGVYHNCRGFVHGVFTICFGSDFAFEAKLGAAMHAIEMVQKF